MSCRVVAGQVADATRLFDLAVVCEILTPAGIAGIVIDAIELGRDKRELTEFVNYSSGSSSPEAIKVLKSSSKADHLNFKSSAPDPFTARGAASPMTRPQLLEFLRKHRLGVLSSVSSSGEPEAAVVGIAVTDRLELVFDTLDTTRKVSNLRRRPKIAFVIGWDAEITVQLEGVADEPKGAELDRLKQVSLLRGLSRRSVAPVLARHHILSRPPRMGPLQRFQSRRQDH